MDEDGFLYDPHEWNHDTAVALADDEGVGTLTENHWRVIGHLRRHFLETGALPPMRLICHEIGLHQHCVSDLFGDPESAWRVAGLPKPGEEFKSYLATAETMKP
jgi:tRNA 2-thiouridine synthesizing protein E